MHYIDLFPIGVFGKSGTTKIWGGAFAPPAPPLATPLVMKDQYRERRIMRPREIENLSRDYLCMHRNTTTVFGHGMVVTKAIRLKKHTVLFLIVLLFLYVTPYFCCSQNQNQKYLFGHFRPRRPLLRP